MRDVIIIGGGASGMIAAITAARRGANVLILERLNRIGKKILTTGNGRCNMTNTQITASRYHSYSTCQLAGPLEAFDYEKTIAFFEELGIMPLIEEHKVYPLSEQANSILDVLRLEIERLGVTVEVDTKVTALVKTKQGWRAEAENGMVYEAKSVIAATGGMTNTSLGCDGLGYQLLRKQGHTLMPTFPTLVHVLSPSPYCKMMKGTKIKAEVTIETDGKKARTEYGEVLFTEDGLSGPPIFQISRIASKADLEGQKAMIYLDLFRNIKEADLIGLLYKRIGEQPQRAVENLFLGMLHKRVVIPLLKCAEVADINRSCDTLEYEEIERMVKTLKAFPFKVQGTRDYKFAQVTAGGIKVDEIDLETMASKKQKDLYITGEVVDVDGDCGGFNLQWAWSTGYIAGSHVKF